jgi:hypothetical protein
LLWTLVTAAAAEETHAYRIAAKAECPLDAVDAHVREQIAKYGPLSSDREYFGFIFIVKGEIGSAITRGRLCYSHTSCAVDTALAAPRIPKGAKVLGEWHTHPKLSSALLSDDDVRGAQNNRRIRCYARHLRLGRIPDVSSHRDELTRVDRQLPQGSRRRHAHGHDPASDRQHTKKRR